MARGVTHHKVVRLQVLSAGELPRSRNASRLHMIAVTPRAASKRWRILRRGGARRPMSAIRGKADIIWSKLSSLGAPDDTFEQ